MNRKIVIGMSGGVDSSVAAALLVQQGYAVTGVTMNIWDGTSMAEFEGRHACFGPDEAEDAAKAAEVCRTLGIPFHQFDLQREYRDIVLSDFSDEYRQGRTPNPCVRCNSRVKFGALVEKVREAGISFDLFATGHYARTSFDEALGQTVLLRASDLRKDQSYFLYRLTPRQLETTLFPLGSLSKERVKQLAGELGLGYEGVRESQDFICGDYTDLLDFAMVPGNIVDTNGTVLGRHQGYARYTIGQRRGLGVASDKPLYVVGINRDRNEVIVGFREQGYGHALKAEQMHWLVAPEKMESVPFEAQVKIRSQQQPVAARINPEKNDAVTVEFLEPQWAVTPGQSVVLYDGDVVLGGGIIAAELDEQGGA